MAHLLFLIAGRQSASVQLNLSPRRATPAPLAGISVTSPPSQPPWVARLQPLAPPVRTVGPWLLSPTDRQRALRSRSRLRELRQRRRAHTRGHPATLTPHLLKQ